MFETRKELIAYLAGFLDGEGSLGIYENGRGFMAKMSAGQVDLRPLELLRETFGGSITVDKRSYTTRFSTSTIAQWQVAGNTAYEALLELRPYLLLKGEQADCLIALQESINSRKNRLSRNNAQRAISDEAYLEMGTLCVRCKALNNKRGPAATTKREGLPHIEEVSDSLNCIDGKDAEVAEMATRLSRVERS